MQTLMPAKTLKNTGEFKKVYSRGRYAADDLFVVYALANEADFNRLGLSINKKVGKAVVRNRVRRWLKESYRTHFEENIKRGYDFVIVARSASGGLAGDGAFIKVTNSLSKLFKRLKI